MFRRKKEVKKLDNKSLIAILENPTMQGTEQHSKAMEELKARQLSPTALHNAAIAGNAVVAKEMILKDNIAEEKVQMHRSIFLDEEEIKEIYIQALEDLIKYKDQFRFNVWSYAIGGI